MQTIYTRQGQVVVPRPNWTSPVTEVFEYKTEIFMAEDGEEIRYAHRMMPRISVRYLANMINGPEREMFEDYVTPGSTRSFVVPCRWRHVSLTADLAATSGTISITGARPWWLQAGCTLVLESAAQQEVVEVDSVSDGVGDFTITLDAATTLAFSAGDMLMLGYWSHYPEESKFTSLVRASRQITPEFLARPEMLPEWELPATSRPAYKGFEILPGRHNWRFAIATELNDRREVVDFGRGVRDIAFERAHRIQTENRTYTMLTRDLANSLIHDFMRHRGMRKPFWTRPAINDFPAFDFTTSNRVHFHDTEFATLYENDPIYRHLWVQWPDGSFQINRIASFNESGGATYVIMEDAWEEDMGDAEIGFAILARFGADRLELRWFTDEACEARLPVKALHCDWVYADHLVYPVEVPVLTSDPGAWTDPATYSEIVFASSGTNAELLAAGDARFRAEWKADTTAEAPNTWTARLDVAFYDASDAQISSYSDTGTQAKGGDDSIVTVDVAIDRAIPTDATSARFRMVMTHDHETPEVDFASVEHAEWGLLASGDNLKWF